MDWKETLHFHNQPGVARVRVGVKEFMCIGALPPFDHPHVFLDMGEENDAVCPYCATLYILDPRLGASCDPPQCAYTFEREVDFSGPAMNDIQQPLSPPQLPPAPPMVELGADSDGLIASFESESAQQSALHDLNAEHFRTEGFGPTIPERSGSSFMPKLILLAGLIGVLSGFAMESYANLIAYPLNIGGRPEFSWPSFVPIAFEIGALLAVVIGFVGYMCGARLFKYHDPIDEQRPMRRAMRDSWIVSIRARDYSRRKRALEILLERGAQDVEEIGA